MQNDDDDAQLIEECEKYEAKYYEIEEIDTIEDDDLNKMTEDFNSIGDRICELPFPKTKRGLAALARCAFIEFNDDSRPLVDQLIDSVRALEDDDDDDDDDDAAEPEPRAAA